MKNSFWDTSCAIVLVGPSFYKVGCQRDFDFVRCKVMVALEVVADPDCLRSEGSVGRRGNEILRYDTPCKDWAKSSLCGVAVIRKHRVEPKIRFSYRLRGCEL